MKIKTMSARITLLALFPLAGYLPAQPETMELREPTAINVVQPSVPYPFSRYGMTGRVEVTFRLDAAGRPQNIVVESASHDDLATSVKNALRHWRYEEPAEPGLKYRLPVVFR